MQEWKKREIKSMERYMSNAYRMREVNNTAKDASLSVYSQPGVTAYLGHHRQRPQKASALSRVQTSTYNVDYAGGVINASIHTRLSLCSRSEVLIDIEHTAINVKNLTV